MPFTIIREDITKVRVDAIVNAANTRLLAGGGVCGAIFHAAGAAHLQAVCDELAPIRTGEAVATLGFALPAKFVIHTAGPVYEGGGSGEEALLRSSYINSLRVARKNGCASIAFPLISSGIYGYPKTEAFRVASNAILDFLNGRVGDDTGDSDMDVILIVLDKDAISVTGERLSGIQKFIDDCHTAGDTGRPSGAATRGSENGSAQVAEPLANNLNETFSVVLIKLIGAKGMTEADVYRRANIDRRHFSKIRSNASYVPDKSAVIALAVALKLPINDVRTLLAHAGYALSRCVLSDIIVEYFVTKGKYDIFEINEALFHFDQLPLGGAAV
jgi:O-acetyl-ADP-ribose deacetylase (regulator of RNase III)